MKLTRARLWSGALVDLVVVDGALRLVSPSGSQTGSVADDDVDLGGRLVIPGLWDHHVHFGQWAVRHGRLDLSAAQSPGEVLTAVGAALGHVTASALDGEGARLDRVLVGSGFRGSAWLHTVNAALLDSVTGDVPVVLVGADLHSAWVNSAALRAYELVGHGRDAGDDRADSDDLARTGVVREQAWFALSRRLADAKPTPESLVAAARAAARRGVVGIVDFEMGDTVAMWSEALGSGGSGGLGLRVACGVWPEQLDEVVASGLATGDELGEPGSLLRLGALKVIADGSLGSGTAYCHRAYAMSGSHGALVASSARLRDLLGKARAARVLAAVHAIGDLAADVVLDAFAVTRARGSIEHAQLLRPEAISRLASMGLVASVQPAHLLDDREAMDREWPEATEQAFPLASLRAAGVGLAFGSDAPVAPLDPWLAVSAAVWRARDGEDSWHREQAVSVAQALAASVVRPVAWGGRPDAGAGVSPADRLTLCEGMVANLAVLDLVPGAAGGTALDSLGAGDLARMPIAGTLLGGAWTHRDEALAGG